MKKLTVDLNYIEFETFDLANENINYPHSGLWMVTVNKSQTDLRFVDKKSTLNFFIAPESMCNEIFNYKEPEIVHIVEPKKQYDGDFILEFSRILLNRK